MDFAAAYRQENSAFAELVGDVGAETPVPTCPGWTFKHLLRHVGRGDRWSAQIVRNRLDHPLDPLSVEGGKPPADAAGAIDWLRGGPGLLVDAVQQTGADTPVWTFLGPRPASWWVWRRLHEVAVHRADAAIALGRKFTLDADVAADGITEWLEWVAIQSGLDGAEPPLNAGTTIHLHATDAGLNEPGEWTVGVDGEGVTWSHEHGKGTAAIRGGATELLLVLTRRALVSDTGVEVCGEDSVWQQWLDRTPF